MKDYTLLSPEEKQALIQKAYDRGYFYENSYSNCGQCTLAALNDVFPDLGIDEKIYKAAFALGGGLGQTTRGTCGALSGAAMAVSLLLGREMSHMEAVTQNCFDVAHRIYEKFSAKFEGMRCCEVQTHIFGRYYEFRKEGELEGYLAAGGHSKCGTVVGTAASLVAELLVNSEIR